MVCRAISLLLASLQGRRVGRVQSVVRPAARASAADELTPATSGLCPLSTFACLQRVGLGDKLKKRSGEAGAHVQMQGVCLQFKGSRCHLVIWQDLLSKAEDER